MTSEQAQVKMVESVMVSKRAAGLSSKGTVVLAGIPDETIILGSVDPGLIRQILLEHLAQFSFCYQNELDADSKPKDLWGVIQLNFNVSPRGEVQKAIIEVKQPMNFYPKRY